MAQSAADLVADLTEGMDDSLQPLDDKTVAKTDEKDTPKDDPIQEDGGKDDTEPDDKKDDDAEEDEGYTIDEVDSDSDDKEEEQVKEEPKDTQFTPEQQYILDNLQPIKVRGLVGDKDEVKEYTVYHPSQLPQGFKAVDDRERILIDQAFTSMENRALKLQGDFRNQEGRKAQKAYKDQEDKADWEDIASLQKSGGLSKFKIKPSEKGFSDDPTSVLIDKVLEFKEKLNNEYLESYNNGRPYRHIGFEDAYHKYLRENPPQKKDPAEDKEDKDRKEVAKRTRGISGDPAKNTTKPPVLRNKRDIDNYIDSLEF